MPNPAIYKNKIKNPEGYPVAEDEKSLNLCNFKVSWELVHSCCIPGYESTFPDPGVLVSTLQKVVVPVVYIH